MCKKEEFRQYLLVLAILLALALLLTLSVLHEFGIVIACEYDPDCSVSVVLQVQVGTDESTDNATRTHNFTTSRSLIKSTRVKHA